MANKTLKTRIKLKYDTLANWQGDGADVVLLKGEVAICEIPTDKPGDAPGVNPPAILFKVGDGTKTFAQLPWVSGLAADVYAWAKKATLAVSDVPNLTVSKLTDFTSQVNTLITSKVDSLDATLTASAGNYISGITQTDGKITSISQTTLPTAPTYTLETGTDEGSVVLKKDGVAVGDDVVIAGYEALKSSIAAKYTKPEDGIPETDLAETVQTSLGKADSALQKSSITTGSANGTIAVGGTDISVKGLGSAAYTGSEDYEAAGTVSTHNSSPTAHQDIRNLITTLSQTIAGLGNALHFVGAGDLESRPEEGQDGDVYVCTDGKEYVWSNDGWQEFGSPDHITKAQADGYYDAKGTAQSLINTLDGNITGTPGVAKTLTALTQTDGKVTATFADIALPAGQVSGLGKFATVSTLSIGDVADLQTTLDGKEASGTAAGLIGALDVNDAAVSNQYVTVVKQTDGKIAVTRKQVSYNELADKPSLPDEAANGALKGLDGTTIFTANQSTDDTIIMIDCGSATELV